VRVVVDLAIEEEQPSSRPDEGGRPMARRTFDVIDVTEILMHWHAGRSKNEMAQSLGVDRKTPRKYIAPGRGGGHQAGRAGQERAGMGGAGAGLVPAAG
jgi:fermentation-respiration switch protein FrsA (DUF1100 family)